MMPHSRYTGINEAQLQLAPLNVLVTGIETGPALLVSHDHKNSFLLGHLEYYTETLKEEYLRDKAKGLKTALPKNYFSDQQGTVINRWRGHASLFFSNWIHETYQRTPYDLQILPTRTGYYIGNEWEGGHRRQ